MNGEKKKPTEKNRQADRQTETERQQDRYAGTENERKKISILRQGRRQVPGGVVMAEKGWKVFVVVK